MFCLLPMTSIASNQQATATGIPLDRSWKVKVYRFALEHVNHPAWGLTHSERDYQITVDLASREKKHIDKDVIFAAAFLHDVGGLPPYDEKGVDHAVRSVQVVEPLLKEWGFPSSKIDLVKETILKHVYYGKAGLSLEAILFRDADILDFIGPMGIARILSVTLESKKPALISNSIATLRKFAKEMPEKLTSEMARQDSKKRVKEMNRFLDSFQAYTYDGKAM